VLSIDKDPQEEVANCFKIKPEFSLYYLLSNHAELKDYIYQIRNNPDLREYILDESIDLTYTNLVFNFKSSYNILFKEQNGINSAAQITAFEDTC